MLGRFGRDGLGTGSCRSVQVSTILGGRRGGLLFATVARAVCRREINRPIAWAHVTDPRCLVGTAGKTTNLSVSVRSSRAFIPARREYAHAITRHQLPLVGGARSVEEHISIWHQTFSGLPVRYVSQSCLYGQIYVLQE